MIKKLNSVALIVLLTIGAKADILEEWTFLDDAAGTLLVDASNTGVEESSFENGGSGVLETDGVGSLISSPTAAGLWDDGATINADISDASVLYLRYDLDYDLSSGANRVGTTIGITFVDNTGTNIAGLVAVYDPTESDEVPPGRTLEEISGDLAPAGRLSAIVKVNTETSTMTCWYDTSRTPSFDESTPSATTTISIASIADLRIRATGLATTATTAEYVALENIRVADTWAGITAELAVEGFSSLNEWIFDSDPAGRTLSEAINTGTDGAVFSADTIHVTQTDGVRGLVCANDASSNDYLWTSGSILTADVTNQASGVRFLRYDLDYDVTAAGYDAGTLLALAFSDGSSTNLAGIALEYVLGVTNDAPPVGIEVSEITSFGQFSGQLSVIAKVDIDNQMLSAWYDLSGENVFNGSSNPDATISVRLTSIDDLVFWATGDFIPTETGEAIVIDNIRTAGTWDEIVREIEGIPFELTIDVLTGEMNSGFIALTNESNGTTAFTAFIREPLPASLYRGTETLADRFAFFSGFDLFPEWDGTQTEEMDIGFQFAPFGLAYTRFSVSQTGTILLRTASGAGATLKPFEMSDLSDQSTIHYRKFSDRLIVAWGNGTGLEFQAWINADGTVQYLYEFGTWGTGTIGANFDEDQTFSYMPGQTARDCLLLTPEPWVSINPDTGAVGGKETQTFTVAADAGKVQTAQTLSFAAIVDWGTKREEINVTLNILDMAAIGVAVSPSPLEFSGPAGFITHATMSLVNTGNVAMAYVLTDTGLKTAGYNMELDLPYSWSSLPPTSEYILTSDVLDTEPVSIGFPFTFFGSVHSNLIVGVDGTLSLGDRQIIVPFSGSLTTVSGSSIRAGSNLDNTRFIVTWQGMVQPGGGNNQTFQAELYRDTGIIRFNYQQLTGAWTNGVILLDGDINSEGAVMGTLSNESTTVSTDVITTHTEYTTNAAGFISGTTTYTTNTVVTYTPQANLQSIQFVPGKQQIISAMPLTGIVAGDSVTLIDVTGDARTLTPGGGSSVIESTDFNFLFTGISQSSAAFTNDATVTFTATNSIENSYPRVTQTMAANMWGVIDPAKISSVQNADGSRTVSWPAAFLDGLSRTYTVEYTTSLTDPWKFVATVINRTSYRDDDPVRNAEPVLFYRVTVQ